MNPHDDVEGFVLGALDADDERVFRQHLPACASCRDEIAAYAGVMSSLRSIRQAGAPPVPALAKRRYWREAVAAVLLLGIGGGSYAFVERPDRDLALIAAMIADHPQQIVLSGTSAAGSVIVGRQAERTAFVVRGLPEPAAGRGYQVWVRGARVSSPGMLHRTRDGLEILVVRGDAVRDAHRIGVTIEAAGGSPTRTGPTQVSAKV